jgi:asparagine synthase (glutamine-hydrolysing)
MCGFVVVIDSEREVEPKLVVKMRDAIIHRGPDEEGIWLSENRAVGFGTRRLKIIDLVGGQQPMASEDGAFVIAYNGEVYNHQSLRAELERSGRRFNTRCDTEVVLASYEAYGDDCLARLDGMFAFALWDQRHRRLFFARDRAGEKPLYYASTRNGLVFASEIKALLEHPDIGRSVDLEALGYYLSFLTTPPPSTLFAGISKLPAGHCGSWDLESGLRTWRWWELPPRNSVAGLTENEAAAELGKLFADAVRERMMSDVPIGVYLSGGVDSSANVAFMSRHSTEPLRTFSVAFEDEPSLDELGNARAVSEYFGTEHHEVILSDNDVIACLPALVHHQDEPIGDPVCVPVFHLAQLTKACGVTVVQIGEGSDESFFGYPLYAQVFKAARLLRWAQRVVPRRLIRTSVVGLAPFLGAPRTEFMLETLTRGVPAPHAIAAMSEQTKNHLLVDSNGHNSAFDFLVDRFGSGVTNEEIASIGLAHEFNLRMPELLLMRIDKMTMASSVEARAPFLDLQLIEFAAQLPLALHWTPDGGKRLLKQAFSNFVPDFVLRRKKQGFGAPVRSWLTSLQAIAQRELLRDPLYAYFQPQAVRDVLSSTQTTRHGFEFWALLNFALWHRHWIEGDDLRESPSFARPSKPQLGIRSKPNY